VGATKRNLTGRFTDENVQHIFSVCMERWPHLSVSAALDLIVGRDRGACELRQRLLCPQIQPRKVVDSSLGETGERCEKSCAQGKRA
jgi:hypothetical protein